MAKITEKEAKRLGFDTTNHIGGFPIEVRMLFVARYRNNSKINADVIDNIDFENPGAADELKKYLLDRTLMVCKKYIERFKSEDDQEKVDYLRDCVQNKGMYFLSEADIDAELGKIKMNQKDPNKVKVKVKDLRQVNEVGLHEKRIRVSEFINNHNPNIENIPEALLEWKDALIKELNYKINNEYMGKHAILSYPELEVFYCMKLHDLYKQGELDDNLIMGYIDEVKNSTDELRCSNIRKLSNRMYTIMDRSFKERGENGLSIELDKISLLFEDSKKTINYKWRALIDERRNEINKQNSDVAKADYVGKHMKPRDKGVLEGANALGMNDDEPEAPVLRKAKSLRKEEIGVEEETGIDVDEIINKLDFYLENDKETTSMFAEKILNPKTSVKKVAFLADDMYRQTIGDKPREKNNKKRLAKKFEITYLYNTKIDKLNELRNEYLKAVDKGDNRAIGRAEKKLEKEWLEFKNYANAKNKDGISNRHTALVFAGKLQAVNIADTMLEGKKIDGKKHKRHEIFNVIDKSDNSIAQEYMRYTVNYEKDEDKPLKRIGWAIKLFFNNLDEFSNKVRNFSLLGEIGALDYAKYKRVGAPTLDVRKARYISSEIFNGYDITKDEIDNIVKKRDRNEIER